MLNRSSCHLLTARLVLLPAHERLRMPYVVKSLTCESDSSRSQQDSLHLLSYLHHRQQLKPHVLPHLCDSVRFYSLNYLDAFTLGKIKAYQLSVSGCNPSFPDAPQRRSAPRTFDSRTLVVSDVRNLCWLAIVEHSERKNLLGILNQSDKFGTCQACLQIISSN